MTDTDRTIIRVLTKDMEALKAAFPNITCPFCEAILFGLPQSMIETFGANRIGLVHIICQPCGQRVGYNPLTGNVWKAAEDQRTPWPGVEVVEVKPL